MSLSQYYSVGQADVVPAVAQIEIMNLKLGHKLSALELKADMSTGNLEALRSFRRRIDLILKEQTPQKELDLGHVARAQTIYNFFQERLRKIRDASVSPQLKRLISGLLDDPEEKPPADNTIFYLLGGLGVVAAGILLFTCVGKRR